jgi:hypothetical protein
MVECLESCEKTAAGYHLENVINSSANILYDIWPYSRIEYGDGWVSKSSFNSYEYGTRGKWRTHATYTYNTSISGIESSASLSNNFESGLYDDFILFNHGYLPANENTDWLKLNVVNSYAPNGGATQDSSLVGTYSAVYYGYDNTLPLFVANNALRAEVYYEGFEKTYTISGISYLEEAVQLFATSIGQRSTAIAHTGKASMRWNLGTSTSTSVVTKIWSLSNGLTITNTSKENGLVIRFWIKQAPVSGSPLTFSPWSMSGMLSAELYVVSTVVASQSFSSIAKSGDWELMECVFQPSDLTHGLFVSGNTYIPKVKLFKPMGTASSNYIYMDDVSVHPVNTLMKCYVYDTDYKRISAVLDEQHFSTLYQYDAEGRLESLKKETEQGVKTITEKKFHLPTITK